MTDEERQSHDQQIVAENLRKRTHSGNSSIVKTAIVIITDEQIKALPTTSIELVAPPGAGKMIIFHMGVVYIDSSHGAYISGGGGTLRFKLGNVSISGELLNASFDLSSFFDLGRNLAIFPPYGAEYLNHPITTWFQRDDVEDGALLFDGANSLGIPFSGGHELNSGYVKVWYTIEDLDLVA